jgi:hypothetical protein
LSTKVNPIKKALRSKNTKDLTSQILRFIICNFKAMMTISTKISFNSKAVICHYP